MLKIPKNPKICILKTILIISLLYFIAPVNSNKEWNSDSWRLPKALKPKLYELHMRPYLLGNFSYDGSVVIHFDCLEDTNKIVLHSQDLIIITENVTLNSYEEIQIPLKKHKFITNRNFYIVYPKVPLHAGETYKLQIPFTGILNTYLHGFYRASYVDENSKELKWIATTHFEAIHARKAFPCFDEPNFKAQFKISITHVKSLNALSNMPLIGSKELPESSEWVTDIFDETPAMSTYLVAFIVSDFDHLETQNGKLRVWARKDQLSKLTYALELAPKIQSQFENYFEVPFPFPKQDFVAIPEFSSGAMENIGLIMFRETHMLFDPQTTPAHAKEQIAKTISHELSHQWFGNLVTMKWWDGIFLNEGFARFSQAIGVDLVEPSWKIMDRFVISTTYKAFASDEWNSSRPIVSSLINTPDDIAQSFDDISYDKGASLIRMLQKTLTEATLKEALHNYLVKWKYKNTVQDDFWKAVTEQAHKDKTLDDNISVKSIMDTWTMQKGIPVVRVTRSYDESNQVQFVQDKVNFPIGVQDTDPFWWIPISYSTPKLNSKFSNTSASFWIRNDEKKVSNEIKMSVDDWMIVNVQLSGLYRVNYDIKNWLLIKSQLDIDFEAFHVLNRAQIANDVFNLARQSFISYELAFALTEFVRKDSEFVVWSAYIKGLSNLLDVLSSTAAYGSFQAYMRKQLEQQYDKFGLHVANDGDAETEKLHRSTIISSACSYGVKACVDYSQRMFRKWMNSSNPDTTNEIRKNFRETIYCKGMRLGGEEEWNFLWERYKNTMDVNEKLLIFMALPCTNEMWLLDRYLQLTITPEVEGGCPQQLVGKALNTVAKKPIGYRMVLTFMDDNWTAILKRLGATGLAQLKSPITSISSQLKTPSELKQFKNFIDGKEFGAASHSINQGLERIQTNIHWMKTHYKTVSKWLFMTQFSSKTV